MAQFWEGDKVGLTGTVTYVDGSLDPPMVSLEIDGYTPARVTLSANYLTLVAKRAPASRGSKPPRVD